MRIRRYARSGYRKGRRLYKYARANPQKALAFAKTALHGLKVIRGLVNSEMFHVDQTCQLGSNQSTIFNLTGIGQNDSVSGRTGNSILAKSLVMNGYMYVNPSVTTNSRVMIALILDTQQVSDTTPAITDIFTSSGSPHTLLNINNAGRFKVLMRKQYTLDSNSAGQNAKQFKFFKRFGFHVRYNGTSSSDLQKNGIYLVIITSEPTNYPTVELITRFNYHDN